MPRSEIDILCSNSHVLFSCPLCLEIFYALFLSFFNLLRATPGSFGPLGVFQILVRERSQCEIGHRGFDPEIVQVLGGLWIVFLYEYIL